MRDFQELQVWQRAHGLTLKVYEATRDFPNDEKFGLTSQLRRAAASVAANIAEGCGRNGDAELARFLTIALGSLAETNYFIVLARDLAYLTSAEAEDFLAEISTSKLIFRLTERSEYRKKYVEPGMKRFRFCSENAKC